MGRNLDAVPILVTGSNGKLGRLLRVAWRKAPPRGCSPLWQSREIGDVLWRMLAEPYNGPTLAGGIILNFAGVTRGDVGTLAQNTELALAACDLAQKQGARHVFLLSSAAVYGAGQGVALDERAPCLALNDYGRAKLAMEAAVAGRPDVTVLRLGNVVGADALIGGNVLVDQVVLDPVVGQSGGPERSYIGPAALASVLAQLCQRVLAGQALPNVLNVAAPNVVAMADLLTAAGLDWRFGPKNPKVLPRIELDVARLQSLLSLPLLPANAQGMVDDWRNLHEGRL